MTDEQKILASVQRTERSNRWTNYALWVIIALALFTVTVSSATFSKKINRDHDQLQLLTTANINLLRWAASDHSDKDSSRVLKKIQQDLSQYLDQDKKP